MPEPAQIISIPPPVGVEGSTALTFREGDLDTAQVMQVLDDDRYLLLIRGRLLMVQSLLDFLPAQSLRLRVKEAGLPVQLEVVASELPGAAPRPLISPDPRGVLVQMGFEPTEEANNLARAMLDAGIPLSSENFRAVSTSLASVPPELAEPVLSAGAWMTGHGIPLDARMLEALAGTFSSTASLAKLLDSLHAAHRDAESRALSADFQKTLEGIKNLIAPLHDASARPPIAKMLARIETALSADLLLQIQSAITHLETNHPIASLIALVTDELSSALAAKGAAPGSEALRAAITAADSSRAIESLLGMLAAPENASEDEVRSTIANLLSRLSDDDIERLREKLGQHPDHRFFIMRSDLERLMDAARELVDRTSAFRMLNLTPPSAGVDHVLFTEIPIGTGDSRRSLIARVSYRKKKGRASKDSPVRATIEMEMENLGTVMSEVEVKGKHVRTVFQVEQVTVKDLFLEHHEEFLDSLRALGMKPVCDSVVAPKRERKVRAIFERDIPRPAHPGAVDVVA